MGNLFSTRVVGLRRFVEAAPGDRDPVLGALELGLQVAEVLVRLELRDSAPTRRGAAGARRRAGPAPPGSEPGPRGPSAPCRGVIVARPTEARASVTAVSVSFSKSRRPGPSPRDSGPGRRGAGTGSRLRTTTCRRPARGSRAGCRFRRTRCPRITGEHDEDTDDIRARACPSILLLRKRSRRGPENERLRFYRNRGVTPVSAPTRRARTFGREQRPERRRSRARPRQRGRRRPSSSGSRVRRRPKPARPSSAPR